jgi:hypothetical protein
MHLDIAYLQDKNACAVGVVYMKSHQIPLLRLSAVCSAESFNSIVKGRYTKRRNLYVRLQEDAPSTIIGISTGRRGV